MRFSKAVSASKSMAPIFSFMHLKPCLIFSSILSSISSYEPIHTRPLIGMPVSPRLKAVSNRAAEPRWKFNRAVSSPKSIEG